MTDTHDPTSTAELTFLAELRRLRAVSGQPSFRRLSQIADQRIAAAPPDARPEPLPPSTASEVLAGKRLPRLPRWGFVESYVAACLVANGADEAAVAAETARWRERWSALAVADGPARPEPPVRRPRRRWIAVAAVALVFVLGAGSGLLIAARWNADPVEDSADACVAARRLTGKDLLKARTTELARQGWWLNNAGLGTLHGDSTRLDAVVSGGTTQLSDVLAIQSDVTIVKGREYVLAFTTVADRDATILVRVQELGPGYLPSLHRNVDVGQSACHRVYRFTGAQDDTHVELTFQIGGLPEGFRLSVSDIALLEV